MCAFPAARLQNHQPDPRFYKLTAAGRRRLRADADTWDRYATAVGRILGASSGPAAAKR